MKKLLTLTMSIGFVTIGAFTQTNTELKADVTHIVCEKFSKTQPLRELIKNHPVVSNEFTEDEFSNYLPKDRKVTADWSTISDHGIPDNNNQDPVAQLHQGTRSGTGLLKANWQSQGSGGYPPDPSGAAGIEHYIQGVNSTYRIYNKDGSGASPTLPLNYLFDPTGSDIDGDGDPIIMYDRYADRWFISQFQNDLIGLGPTAAAHPNSVTIAISESSDPLGAYYTYIFSFNQFPDYPKFGVWSNGYYMSANSGNKNCVIFEREKMLLGDPSASMISMTFPASPFFFKTWAPSYAEGPTEPGPNDPFYFFHIQDNSWSGVSNDHIKAFKCVVDWNTPINSNITIDQEISIASLNTVFSFSWDDISQPGTTQKLDALSGIIIYRAQYRKFEDYNCVLMTTVADVNGANKAGIRWFELREDGDEQWYVYQEGTYSPDNNSRWNAGISMDLNGNIGMAYSFVGPNDKPGIRFTGRYAGDPLGEMTVMEQIAVEGTSVQTAGTNRWGDYAQMTVDPTDDATFWYTGEYRGGSNSSAPRTRVFSFAMWELLGMDEEVQKQPFFNAFQPNPTELKVIWKDLADEEITISILDMNGKLVAEKSNIDVSANEKSFEMPATASGIYLIKLSGQNTNLSERVFIAK